MSLSTEVSQEFWAAAAAGVRPPQASARRADEAECGPAATGAARARRRRTRPHCVGEPGRFRAGAKDAYRPGMDKTFIRVAEVWVPSADGSLLDYESATSHNITVRVTDAGGLTYDETFTINLANINEGPTFSNLNGAPTYVEGGAAVVLDSDAQITDPELSSANNFNGATLTLQRQGGANSQDMFSATGTLSPLIDEGPLVVNGITIGGVLQNAGGTLILLFNGNATGALVNAAMQQIAYSNSSDAPPSSVQVNWTFSDGNSGTQGTGGAATAIGNVTVSITAVNDAPTLNALSAVNVSENASAQTVSLAAANAQPKQEQQSAPVDAPDDKAGPSESANEAMPTEASVTPLANGQQVLTAQALKAQGNAQAPGQDAASATALPQQGEGAEATKENVAAVSPSMEKQSEEKDGESSLLSKVTDLLMQADRKIQELKDAMSSSPASSNQDVELSFAEFRAETAHWTSGDSSSGETSRQFDMTSQAEQSKTTGAAGPPSGPQASFGHTMVEAGTNGTAASSATGNGEPRSLSAPQATSTVRQPEDASPLPQTWRCRSGPQQSMWPCGPRPRSR